jgi:hypothetical protein
MTKKVYKPLFIEASDGVYEPASLEDVIDFFLYYYEGMEHMTEHGVTNPETWYTVTTILRRNLEHIKKAAK